MGSYKNLTHISVSIKVEVTQHTVHKKLLIMYSRDCSGFLQEVGFVMGVLLGVIITFTAFFLMQKLYSKQDKDNKPSLSGIKESIQDQFTALKEQIKKLEAVTDK